MVAPAYVQIPLVPLTDTEVVVYFFQSLSRPSVALRLYARNWGPRNIVDTLHEHRAIDPPYLRNTCSVKCTTAIKLGRKRYGDSWEESYKAVLKNAGDVKATDLMRLADDEMEHLVDYDVRALCTGLIKHPTVGVDGGIFTQCVEYCQENDAPYTLHNVWQLAADLEAGRTPKHPPSPSSSSVASQGARSNRRKAAKDAGPASDRPRARLSTEDSVLSSTSGSQSPDSEVAKETGTKT